MVEFGPGLELGSIEAARKACCDRLVAARLGAMMRTHRSCSHATIGFIPHWRNVLLTIATLIAFASFPACSRPQREKVPPESKTATTPTESVGPEAATDDSIHANRPPALLERFVQLRSGMTPNEVHGLLQNEGQHGFTYLDDNRHTWILEEYFVAFDAGDRSHAHYMPTRYLLYQDGRLLGVISSWDVHLHFKALENTKPPPEPTRGEPYADFDDDTVNREYLRVPAAKDDEIPASMDRLRQDVLECEAKWKRVTSKEEGLERQALKKVVGALFGAALEGTIDPAKLK